MKIAFCFYPLNVKWNHGIALLSALCRRRGVETELLMLEEPGEFRRRLEDGLAHTLCFSAVSSGDYARSIPYMQIARETGRTVLLGGTWCGLGNPVDESVSIVCRGEGESLPDFLRDGDDELFDRPMVCEDLNALPLPDYEMFKGIEFDRGLPETKGKFCLPYVSSRGCPYRCTFCQARLQPPYRIRTKVEEDLSELAGRYRPELFFIGDAQLPYMSEAWRKSWGDFRYPFAGYIRADIKPEHLDWLIDYGMTGCAFGVESGDERFRNDVLHKDLTDGQVWRTVETLRKRNVWYVPFFINGAPGERFIHKTATARMMERIGKYSLNWEYEELRTWQE